MRTPSMSNARLHHAVRAKAVAAQRGTVAWHLAALGRLTVPGGDLSVLLRRVSPRPLDDDNLRGALKAVRDELAVWLGLPDDRDPRVSWLYDQRRGGVKEHAVEVVVGPRVVCSACGAVRTVAA